MKDKNVDGCLIAGWLFGLALTIAIWGVIIWAIITLVQYVTA